VGHFKISNFLCGPWPHDIVLIDPLPEKVGQHCHIVCETENVAALHGFNFGISMVMCPTRL